MLEDRHVEILGAPRETQSLAPSVALIRVDAQLDRRADLAADRAQAVQISARIPSDFDLERVEARPRERTRSRDRTRRVHDPDRDVGRHPVPGAAEVPVERHAGRLSYEVVNGDVDRRFHRGIPGGHFVHLVRHLPRFLEGEAFERSHHSLDRVHRGHERLASDVRGCARTMAREGPGVHDDDDIIGDRRGALRDRERLLARNRRGRVLDEVDAHRPETSAVKYESGHARRRRSPDRFNRAARPHFVRG